MPHLILLIDNYDSFVFNLARYFERLGQSTRVIRNDAIDMRGVRELKPEAIVLSPGPCAPEQAGISIELVRELHAEIPILGVCLGHQAIAAALGGRVVRAEQPVHGRGWTVLHANHPVFDDVPSSFTAARYHSLVVDESSLPTTLEVTARTPEGVVMALAHRSLPVIGFQFHPESVLTDCGYTLLASFLRLAGVPMRADMPAPAFEQSPQLTATLPEFTTPVTF